MADLAKLVDDLSALTVLEAAELSKMLEEKWGVSAAAPVAVAAVAAGAAAPAAEEQTEFESIADLFVGPTAIAVSRDPVAAAKVVADYAKTNDKLKILGGSLGSLRLDVNGVKALATLPSLDELRGKLLGMLSTPATRIAGVLQAPAGQLARVLKAKADKDAA